MCFKLFLWWKDGVYYWHDRDDRKITQVLCQEIATGPQQGQSAGQETQDGPVQRLVIFMMWINDNLVFFHKLLRCSEAQATGLIFVWQTYNIQKLSVKINMISDISHVACQCLSVLCRQGFQSWSSALRSEKCWRNMSEMIVMISW